MRNRATSRQISYFDALLKKYGLTERRSEIIEYYSKGRVNYNAASDLYMEEMSKLINSLLAKYEPDKAARAKMEAKCIAIVKGLGYENWRAFIEEISHVQKPLQAHSFSELQKLVSQLEIIEQKEANSKAKNLKSSTSNPLNND